MPEQKTDLFLDWWRQLSDREDPRRRAERAALRHCATTTEVMFEPCFHALLRRLPDDVPRQRIAAAVAVLAHIDEHDHSRSFAAQLGSPPPDRDRAAYSDLRFRRLLKMSHPDELMRALIHAVRLNGRKGNVPDLARSLWYWGDNTRQHWAFDYYKALS